MAERSIKVRLSANVQDFKTQIGSAATSLDELAKKGDKTGQASQTTMGRLAQSAQLQREAWTTAGTSLLAVGTGLTAINVAVAKTGIEYNTLQQKSRAALTTILGDSKAANEQLAKFDDFARTSPFGKDTFLKAQQQMLGFGIEAEKVIPYLSAINEAVAATGGNNQDIAELTRIFSQVQAAQKITATDLMQFGQRGVDAATLIGSRMGKTGAEIREGITAGTIPAGEALDALAAGMQERFEGASAGVKETMAGAMDRVKAAFRDLSASFMEGAVGPEGGGWLVDMTNQVADLLRFIEDLPGPAKTFVGALSGIAGAGALASGAFFLLAPRAMDTYNAFQALKGINPGLASGLGKVAGVAGAATVAIGAIALIGGAIAADMASWKADVDSYAEALKMAGDAGDEAARKQAAQELALQGVGETLREVSIEESLATDAALGSADARQRIVDRYNEQIDGLRALADEQQAEGNYMEGYTSRADGLISSRDRVLEQIDAEAEKRGLSAEQVANESALMAASTEVADENAGARENLADASERLAESLGMTGEEFEKWSEMVSDSSGSFIDLMGGWDAVIAKNQEVATAAAESSSSTEDSWQDFYDGHTVALADYLAELEAQVAAQQAWQDNMVLLASRVSEGTLTALAELGPKGAPLVAALVSGTDAELKTFEANFGRAGQQAGAEFSTNLAAAGPVLAAVAQRMGAGAVAGVAAEISSGGSTLQGIIDKYNLQATIDANADPAIQAAHTAMNRINSMTATLQVNANIQRNITQNITRRVMGQAPIWTGGGVDDVATAHGLVGGGSPRRQPAGRVRAPGTTTSDSLVDVALSRDEFVHNALARSYYGDAVMYALNDRRIPRQHFEALGLADGGEPSRTYRPSASFMAPSGTATPAMTEIVNQYDVKLEGIQAVQWLDKHLKQSRVSAYQDKGVKLNG